MADIRINALATTAASTASDDFIAVDGSANGTRKLNAYSPTFGGNLTVSGTGSHVFGTTNTVTLAAGTVTATGIGKIAGIQVTGASTAATGVGVEVLWDNTSAIIQGFNRTGSVFTPILVGGSTVGLQIGGVTKFGLDASGNATLSGNLTVSGTGTSSVAGNLNIGEPTGSGYRLYVKAGFGLALGGSYIECGEYDKPCSILNHINPAVSANLFQIQKQGTGVFTVSSAGNLLIGTTNDAPNARLHVLGANNAGFRIDQGSYNYYSAYEHIFQAVSFGTIYGKFANNGSLILKSDGVDSGNGKLQLATHTTSAGGIGFGTDTSLYRSAAGQLRGPSSFIDATFASSGLFFGASMTLQANDNVLIKTNGSVTALTLDSSQNATFAGTVTLPNDKAIYFKEVGGTAQRFALNSGDVIYIEPDQLHKISIGGSGVTNVGVGGIGVAGNSVFGGTVTATGGIVGTTTNDSAAAGIVGQYVSSTVASGSAVSLSNGTAANVTSISLTAGDWDVSAKVGFKPNASTTISYMLAAVSDTSAATTEANRIVFPLNGATTAYNVEATVPTVRISIASTTTIYLVASSEFAVSTQSAFGTIIARRVR